jgi:hypothetical protein
LNEPTVDGESLGDDPEQLTGGRIPPPLGGADRSTLFMVAAEWRGPANMFDGPPSGQVLTATVTVPGAG